VWFVLSLVKKYYLRQFSLFAWTHVALLIVVTQSYLIIQNLFQGAEIPYNSTQCFASGSVCFLAIQDPDPSFFVRIRILPSSSKESEKNLGFYCFVTS
jgi:hypothetical protein